RDRLETAPVAVRTRLRDRLPRTAARSTGRGRPDRTKDRLLHPRDHACPLARFARLGLRPGRRTGSEAAGPLRRAAEIHALSKSREDVFQPDADFDPVVVPVPAGTAPASRRTAEERLFHHAEEVAKVGAATKEVAHAARRVLRQARLVEPRP